MGWGTQSCPKVHKLFGPGNQYVTAAKMLMQNAEVRISTICIDSDSGGDWGGVGAGTEVTLR